MPITNISTFTFSGCKSVSFDGSHLATYGPPPVAIDQKLTVRQFPEHYRALFWGELTPELTGAL